MTDREWGFLIAGTLLGYLLCTVDLSTLLP